MSEAEKNFFFGRTHSLHLLRPSLALRRQRRRCVQNVMCSVCVYLFCVCKYCIRICVCCACMLIFAECIDVVLCVCSKVGADNYVCLCLLCVYILDGNALLDVCREQHLTCPCPCPCP